MPSHTFIFIGGMHRSGTSLLHRCLRDHPQMSGFSGTGVPEDEGQHLQSVYPPAIVYGGPGRFGFRREAHLTEESPLITAANGAKLFAEWSRYWDTSKPFLLEKSPPNLIRARFLQKLFPNSYFVMLLRHPVAVALATWKWRRTSTLSAMVEHSLVCYERFRLDAQYLKNLMVIKYEDFVARPQRTLDAIYSFVGSASHPCTRTVEPNVNQAYFARWEKLRNGFFMKWPVRHLTDRLEDRVRRFDYSLIDLSLI
jgi:hypothetical protein